MLSAILRSMNGGSWYSLAGGPLFFGGSSAVGTGQASPRALLLVLLLALPELLLVDLVHVSCVWCVCFFSLTPRVDVPSR